jgi:energy-coupling factor transporter ATP-binding protein EcfA2
MAIANLQPNDRYAFIGKTGSGKTQLALVMASYFAQTLHSPWEVWWMDTKGDPKDKQKLRAWGFCNGSDPKDQQRVGGLRNALYFIINDTNGYNVVDQVQAKCQEAYERGHVLVVCDEYTECVQSRVSIGYGLDNICARGRGKDVGLFGLTQEPVNIPRKLVSQASHIALFTLTFPRDIKYAREFCPVYTPPKEQGDPHGFYWSHVEGTGTWAYYENQAEWFKNLKIAQPREPKVEDDKNANYRF